ncbi:MAG: hypothetical protein WCR54_08240 [Clostridia bacterium]
MTVGYVKNIIKDLTPSGIKAANDNFDYLYQKPNIADTEVSLINIGNDDDGFQISYTNKPPSTYKMVRGPDKPYISKLSNFSRSINIYHSILGEYPKTKDYPSKVYPVYTGGYDPYDSANYDPYDPYNVIPNYAFIIKQDLLLDGFCLVLANGVLSSFDLDNEFGESGPPLGVTHETEFRNMATEVRSVSYSFYRTVWVKKDNTLWGCGNNYFGQLGFPPSYGTKNLSYILGPVLIMSDVLMAETNFDTTVVVQNNGLVWNMGVGLDRDYGTWGPENSLDYPPRMVMMEGRFVAVSQYTAYIIKTDDTLWSFGNEKSNGVYDLGMIGYVRTSHATSANPPTKITDNVYSVCASDDCVFVLKNDGTLWTFGVNVNGEMGIISPYHKQSFDSLYVVDVVYTPTLVAKDVKFALTYNHQSAFIKSDDTLWTFGINDNNQLGYAITPENSNNSYGGRGSTVPTQIATDVKRVYMTKKSIRYLKFNGTLVVNALSDDIKHYQGWVDLGIEFQ